MVNGPKKKRYCDKLLFQTPKSRRNSHEKQVSFQIVNIRILIYLFSKTHRHCEFNSDLQNSIVWRLHWNFFRNYVCVYSNNNNPVVMTFHYH